LWIETNLFRRNEEYSMASIVQKGDIMYRWAHFLMHNIHIKGQGRNEWLEYISSDFKTRIEVKQGIIWVDTLLNTHLIIFIFWWS
jgi:hypothetical protein